MQARLQTHRLAILGLAVAFGASAQLCGLLCTLGPGTASHAAVEVADAPTGHAGCGGDPPPRPAEAPASCADHDCSDCDAARLGRADASDFGIASLGTPGPLHPVLASALLPRAPRRLAPPEAVPRPRLILRTTTSLLL